MIIKYNDVDKYKNNKIIGIGSESVVYQKDNNNVIKIFDNTQEEKVYKQKQEKLIKLEKLKVKELVNIDTLYLNQNNKSFKAYSMEYLSMYKELFDIQLENKDLFDLMIKFAETLEKLHNNSIIVYDIKSHNIMLDSNMNYKFIDIDSMGIDNYIPEHIGENSNYFPIHNELLLNKDLKTLDKLRLIKMLINYLLQQEHIKKYKENPKYMKTYFFDIEQIKDINISNELKEYFYNLFIGNKKIDENNYMLDIFIKEKKLK